MLFVGVHGWVCESRVGTCHNHKDPKDPTDPKDTTNLKTLMTRKPYQPKDPRDQKTLHTLQVCKQLRVDNVIKFVPKV